MRKYEFYEGVVVEISEKRRDPITGAVLGNTYQGTVVSADFPYVTISTEINGKAVQRKVTMNSATIISSPQLSPQEHFDRINTGRYFQTAARSILQETLKRNPHWGLDCVKGYLVIRGDDNAEH